MRTIQVAGRPFVVFGPVHQSGPNRVKMDIDGSSQEIAVVQAYRLSVCASEDMPAAFILAVVAHTVSEKYGVHGLTQIVLGGLQKKVDMI